MTGSSFWALRTGRGDLAGVEPLRLAAQGLADETQSMSRLTLLVAQVRPEDDDELGDPRLRHERLRIARRDIGREFA